MRSISRRFSGRDGVDAVEAVQGRQDTRDDEPAVAVLVVLEQATASGRPRTPVPLSV